MIRHGYNYDTQRWTDAGLPADYGKKVNELVAKVISGQLTQDEATDLLTEWRKTNS